MIRLYLALGIVGVLVLSHGAAYLKGRSDVSDKARIEQLTADLNQLRADYETEQAARRADAAQAKIDREERELQDLETQELIDALTDRARVCYDAGDADRLRTLVNGKQPTANP